MMDINEDSGNGGYGSEDDQDIDFYTARFKSLGPVAEAVGWSSESTQNTRYRVLLDIGVDENSRVLDVGCGYGKLLTWLEDKECHVNYTGVDITQAMIDGAKELHPTGQFYTGNILTESMFAERSFEYVLASGIFAFRTGGGMQYLIRMASRMFELSLVGCAFNCLSGWREKMEDGEFAPDPCEVLNQCRKITPWVCMRHDYHRGDFTIYMYWKNRE